VSLPKKPHPLASTMASAGSTPPPPSKKR
jgi:hypothetical protein